MQIQTRSFSFLHHTLKTATVTAPAPGRAEHSPHLPLLPPPPRSPARSAPAQLCCPPPAAPPHPPSPAPRGSSSNLFPSLQIPAGAPCGAGRTDVSFPPGTTSRATAARRAALGVWAACSLPLALKVTWENKHKVTLCVFCMRPFSLAALKSVLSKWLRSPGGAARAARGEQNASNFSIFNFFHHFLQTLPA